MLEAGDGDHRSYPEIGEIIEQHSSAANADLKQLWRRMLFSVLISNTDDHLRNHGFIRDDRTNSWNLSPAFDLNPNPGPGPKELSTAIDGDNYVADLDAVMSAAPYFRLSAIDAKSIAGEVQHSVDGWVAEAKRLGIPLQEIDMMANAFTGG